MISDAQQYYKKRSFQLFSAHYWTICGLLNRKQDLEQLVDWADRKRLVGPQKHYYCLILEIEHLLWKYQHHSPLAKRVALFAVNLNRFLNGNSSTYSKGYASKYKRVNSLAE